MGDAAELFCDLVDMLHENSMNPCSSGVRLTKGRPCPQGCWEHRLKSMRLYEETQCPCGAHMSMGWVESSCLLMNSEELLNSRASKARQGMLADVFRKIEVVSANVCSRFRTL